jgi:hypothetical protein
MGAEPRPLWTEDEAAGFLRISARTLRGLRQKGLIRYVALPARRILYRPEDCAAFVESRVKVEEPKSPPTRNRGRGRARSGNVVSFTARRAARLAQ